MEVEAAKTILTEAESNKKVAKANYFFAGARVEGGEPGQIEYEIQIAREQITLAESTIKTLQRKLEASTIRSPCDCVVFKVFHYPGEWVDRGDLLYSLRNPDGSKALVEALVQQEEAAYLLVGAQADVLLTDRREMIQGTIKEINRMGPNKKMDGVSDFYMPEKKYASVIIEMDDAQGDIKTGTPARVWFRNTYRFLSLGAWL
jgi:multidrug resistance efflux pump